MDEGRNGDIILVDTELSENNPQSVGLWVKIPLADVRAASGTIVIGIPGTLSTYSSIIINDHTVVFTDPNSIDTISDDINFAMISNISAVAVGNTIQISEVNNGAINVSANSLGLYSSKALADLNTDGTWAPLRISGTATYTSGQAQLFLEEPEETTYPIIDFSLFNFSIFIISARTSAGSIDISIQINDQSVSDLTDINVTDVRSLTKASPYIPVHIGDTITVLTTNNNNATGLSIMLGYKYRNA